jgi:glutamate dehydrogenase
MLRRYFPEAVAAEFSDLVAQHRLGREILSARLANWVIDRVGPGFLYRIEERTGATPEQAVRAILVLERLLNLEELWGALGRLPLRSTLVVRRALDRFVELNVTWLVRHRDTYADVGDQASALKPQVDRLLQHLLGPALHADAPGGAGGPVWNGTVDLLASCTRLVDVEPLLALAAAASAHNQEVTTLAKCYVELRKTFYIDWLQDALVSSEGDTHWNQLAKSALTDDLSKALVDLATWCAGRGHAANVQTLVPDIARGRLAQAQSRDPADVANLVVAVQVIRDAELTLSTR